MSHPILNTFGLNVTAKNILIAKTPIELYRFFSEAKARSEPVMILGYGSNVLFTTDFAGTVILNRIDGLIASETEKNYLLHVGAGMPWHELVEKTIAVGQNGLENLALIPGSVGSAPIQNIGAYGVEFKQFAHYVELVEFSTGKIIRIEEGQYHYRDSVFKHRYRDGYAVTHVGIKLPKAWQPSLMYEELKKLNKDKPTARDIFDFICQVRKNKLPDPAVMGNAGSFFKNPVVSSQLAKEMAAHYNAMPAYPQLDGRVKLAAGWLIEQCGLKGYQLGGAAIYEKQAIVIVNNKKATPSDVIDLARLVKRKVAMQFHISLEPEIRFIGPIGEIIDTEKYLTV